MQINSNHVSLISLPLGEFYTGVWKTLQGVQKEGQQERHLKFFYYPIILTYFSAFVASLRISPLVIKARIYIPHSNPSSSPFNTLIFCYETVKHSDEGMRKKSIFILGKFSCNHTFVPKWSFFFVQSKKRTPKKNLILYQ